jgi:hypothetical protein
MMADIKKLLAAIAPSGRPVMILSTAQAGSVSILEPPVPLPVILAPNLASDTVIMVDAACFASALGTPDFNVSENPSVHMESATPLPLASGAQGAAVLASPTQSMWQTATTGLRSIIEVDWALRKPSGAAAFISSVSW